MGRSLDGSSQYLYRGSAVLTGVPLTMCAWVKKSSLTVDSCILYAERQSDNAYIGLFHRSTAVNGNLLQGIVSHTNVGATIWNGPAYTAHAWQFVAIRCASTTSRDTWLNTTITSNTAGQSFISNMDELVLGRWDHVTPGLYFDGLVSDVGAWNVALSDSELTALAIGKSVPGDVRQESLCGYYLPSTRRERTDRDYSGYGRELTPYGAPTWGDDPPQTKRRRVRRVGTVATTHALTATGVATGAPSVGSPALGQIHALTATSVSSGAPTVGAPTVGQIHTLAADSVASGAPSVGSPAISQTHALTATGVASGAPTTGSPSLGQVHALAAPGVAAGAPAVGEPVLGQVHALAAVGVDSGTPSVGSPAIGQIHALTAGNVATGTPSVGSPLLNQVHALTATGVATGAPSVGSPELGQIHALTASDVATGTPSVGSPALSQSGGTVSLVAVGVDSGVPSVGTPALSQIHALIALAIASGGPTVGSPALSIATDFVCVDTITLSRPHATACQGDTEAQATLSRADSVSTIQIPTTHAGLRRAYSLSTQRPC